MKKLTRIIFLAIILVPVFLYANEIKVPEYSLQGISPTEIIYVIVDTGEVIQTPKQANGRMYCKLEKFLLDRNQDGRIDLKLVRWNFSEKTVTSFLTGEKYYYPPFKLIDLYIDDDFEGEFDRHLKDSVNTTGKEGADGIFEEEIPF